MQKPHAAAIYWFRRSLRLDDNRALSEAIRIADCVLPVFILDPSLLASQNIGEARVRFLLESLTDLDASLHARGGKLFLRRGHPADVLQEILKESGATALCFSRDYTPLSRARDKAVTDAMQNLGVEVRTASDHLIAEPEDIRSASNGVYTVFTPYKRVWLTHPVDVPVPAPIRINVPEAISSDPIPGSLAEAGFTGDTGSRPKETLVIPGGETEGRRRMDSFLESAAVDSYKTERNFPDREGTSRLSPYLRMGNISPRSLVTALRSQCGGMIDTEDSGASKFLSELAWRDFYYQILWHHPYVTRGAFRPQYNTVAWENDEVLFRAWCEGRTGYPFVDAAQRQLNGEGWMHNRARMASASFLTKDLLCDWRRGERYFMQKLVDGDLASNNGGWQWCAGTGTDAQPFFRIYNPVTQGERFDPDGTYVRKWVPELSRVPTKVIHQPWKLSVHEQEAVGCVLGRDYPHPIVDHKEQRVRALAMYRSVGDRETKT